PIASIGVIAAHKILSKKINVIYKLFKFISTVPISLSGVQFLIEWKGLSPIRVLFITALIFMIFQDQSSPVPLASLVFILVTFLRFRVFPFERLHDRIFSVVKSQDKKVRNIYLVNCLKVGVICLYVLLAVKLKIYVSDSILIYISVLTSILLLRGFSLYKL